MRQTEATIRAQWKTGQSGNPRGRPKKPKPLWDQGLPITAIARILLDEPCQVPGSDRMETRLTRLVRDAIGRADLGDYGPLNTCFNLADRGDRRRLQALRAARRARKPEDAAFERRNAHDISPRTPGMAPDLLRRFAVPAREVRTERVKSRPVERIKDYLPNGEINPAALELSRRANRTKEELELRNQPYNDVLKEALERTERMRKPASRRSETPAPETAAVTGVKTGLGRGLVSGPVTGPGETHRARQTVDAVAESAIRLNDLKNSVALPDAAWLNHAHMNGHNGSHR
jgi:hypothetical protein